MRNSASLRLTAALCLVAGIGLVQKASASVLASDDFNSYTAATALTGGGGGTGWGVNLWSAPSAGSVLATVNSYLGDNKVDMSLTGTSSQIVGSRLLGAPIQQTFYASFVVSYSGVGTNVFDVNDTFGLILSDLTVPSTSVAGNVLNFGLRGGSANAFGIRGGTATGGSTTGGALTANTDYFLVAKLTYSVDGKFDKGELWVNPAPGYETAPGATMSLTAGTGVGAVNSVYFRQAANEVGDTYTFNNLILATDWNDIVPVPEPMSGAILVMGGVAVWLRRRCRA